MCAFPCAACATFINYNHLCSSQNLALVLGRAHLPPVVLQVRFFVYTFVYLKFLGLYSFFFPIAVECICTLPILVLYCGVHFLCLHSSFLSQMPQLNVKLIQSV